MIFLSVSVGVVKWQEHQQNERQRLAAEAAAELEAIVAADAEAGSKLKKFSNKFDREMVIIPPGTFLMGSPSNEQDRSSAEGPQTKVIISKSFGLCKTEVTQSQWKAVMGNNPSHFKGYNLPVEQVSWNDAAAFCEKLNELKRDTLPAGYRYTLPTEAQWEYACRAGTTTRFSYGNDTGYSQLGSYAWYNDNSSSKTHPVGKNYPTIGGCMTCMEVSGSGAWTSLASIRAEVYRTRKGQEVASTGWLVGAVGSAAPIFVGRPIASGSDPA